MIMNMFMYMNRGELGIQIGHVKTENSAQFWDNNKIFISL